VRRVAPVTAVVLVPGRVVRDKEGNAISWGGAFWPPKRSPGIRSEGWNPKNDAARLSENKQRKVGTLQTPKLRLKRFLAVPIIMAPLALGLGGVAFAQNPTEPPPPLPADQIVLNGSCLSVPQVMAAAQDAIALFVPGDQPAGVIVNDNWVPAAAAGAVPYIISTGCVGTAPVAPGYNPLAPTDQIVLNGTCLSVLDVTTAAQDAIALYLPGDQPAGVTVNGNWVPSGIAARPGGTLDSLGCATS
jgi:hypothetical protein